MRGIKPDLRGSAGWATAIYSESNLRLGANGHFSGMNVDNGSANFIG